jgi:CheY-like chemotaxis protein
MVHSVLGRGTTIELWLPIATDFATASIERDSAESIRNVGAKRQLRILTVDDDGLVLANVTAMLEDLGHKVIAVGSGARAIETIDSTADIDLMITDQAMPGMTGLQVIEAVRARRPALPVILATGYAELPKGVDASISRLAKPFTQRALADALANVTYP